MITRSRGVRCPRWAHNPEIAGSNPVSATRLAGWRHPPLTPGSLYSPVAQLAERPAVNRQVIGSSPVGGAWHATGLPGHTPVNSGTWSRGAAWSARLPVKEEVASSNLVGTAQ